MSTEPIQPVPPVAPPPSAAEAPAALELMPGPAMEAAAEEPLAGWSGGMPFLRSADNSFFLFPSGRLQVDGYFFKRETQNMPSDGFLLRRARLETFAWIGRWFGVNIAGDFALAPAGAADPVAQSWVNATDDFVMIAPWENLAMLQVGQFDAPFTLENRTADKYFDFMERSITVRGFGIPTNKEAGAMVHGLLPSSVAYYSVALLNGDGQNWANVDNKFDIMGRAWISPANFLHAGPIENAEIGGSFWVGTRGQKGLPFRSFTTQGGFAFSEPSWTMTSMGTTAQKLELHQQGDLRAFAFEVDLPILHRYGARFEYVHKRQQLGIDDPATTGTKSPAGIARLDGFSCYGEVWWWIIGDDKIIGAPGLELPPRWKGFVTEAPRQGLMLAARVERLDASITSATPMSGPSIGTDKASGRSAATSFELGLNYWYSKRFRATINYVRNHLDGDATSIANAKKKNGGANEDEFLARVAGAI